MSIWETAPSRSSKVRPLPRRKIQEMKKIMQQVPHIQKQNEEKAKQEAQKAEELLAGFLGDEPTPPDQAKT